MYPNRLSSIKWIIHISKMKQKHIYETNETLTLPSAFKDKWMIGPPQIPWGPQKNVWAEFNIYPQ